MACGLKNYAETEIKRREVKTADHTDQCEILPRGGDLRLDHDHVLGFGSSIDRYNLGSVNNTIY